MSSNPVSNRAKMRLGILLFGIFCLALSAGLYFGSRTEKVAKESGASNTVASVTPAQPPATIGEAVKGSAEQTVPVTSVTEGPVVYLDEVTAPPAAPAIKHIRKHPLRSNSHNRIASSLPHFSDRGPQAPLGESQVEMWSGAHKYFVSVPPGSKFE
ncbi:MAG: hypothetical protein K2X27_04275 [Candidatus Obscuribacterales bacterium]|nr:hypothetical protein [Candidatus Obscuribacterales bacterium]